MTPEEREALTPERISDYISELECVVVTRYPDGYIGVEYGDEPQEIAVYLLNRGLNILLGNEERDYEEDDEEEEEYGTDDEDDE